MRATVIVLTNAPIKYSYLIPIGLTVCVGDFVEIVFSNRPMVGLIVSVDAMDSFKGPYKLNQLTGIHSKRAPIPQFLIFLIEWFTTFYCITPYQAFQCVVGLKKNRQITATTKNNINTLSPLTSEQNQVYHQIQSSNATQHLIHGVTGSGKTQIYAHLIQSYLKNHQSVILLIPEISLTPQFTSFFSSVVSSVAVVHSGLTPKKKEEIWNQCRRNEIQLVIGPRSAVFMPLPNLGLIIIDEEHDASYKQDSTPRYHTHDVAFKRAEIQNARVVLGSATPSLVTYAKSKHGQLQCHSLIRRYKNIQMPSVHVLDMAMSQQNHLIHDELIESMKSTLNQNKKVLLLVNRRGYSSFLKCNACGAPQHCTSCDISFTYHSDGYFRCHRCLSIKKMSRQCMSCGKFDVEYFGVGIQKVALEINYLFPSAVITRIDRDTVKNFNQLSEKLKHVSASNILIGTQMISKGHNFSNVGMVGIIGIDTMLGFPDYTASERAFQLLVQMAGRAGRDLSTSNVFIQTFQPKHYIFSFVLNHNVIGFLNQELEFREPFDYPPFQSIINIVMSSQTNQKIIDLYPYVQQFNKDVSNEFGVSVVGPKISPIEKISGYYRHNVFYKIPFDHVDLFKKKLTKFPKKAGVRCIFDINPLSLL
jgi:primosomal protein N' (replication factor Y)